MVCAGLLRPNSAAAGDCPIAKIKPRGKDRAHVLLEAEAYTKRQRFPEARAMYQWMIAHKPDDRDARYALARLDAWDRCFERAGTAYRALLEIEPRDIEARAGLIDMLLWDSRFEEAAAVIDAGMALEPSRPELWVRRARQLQWSGDIVGAIHAADHGVQLAPDDPELRAVRDALYWGQARVGVRADWFQKPGYVDIYTANLSALQRVGAFDLTLDAVGIDRVGGNQTAVLDGRFNAGAVYRTNGDLMLGLTLGFGAPGKVVPKHELRASIWASLFTSLKASFAYSFWEYRHRRWVHIFAPTLTYALSDTLEIEAKAWIALLFVRLSDKYDNLGDPLPSSYTKVAPAAGVRAMWQATDLLRVMPGYTYGAQFDTSGAYGSLSLQSHILSLNADYQAQRSWGLLPGAALEYRVTNSVWIISAELGAYVRW